MRKKLFQLVTEEIHSNILIVTDKNPSLGCLTKQLKMSPIIWIGRDMGRYILLTIPDKDCLHSALGVGLVPRLVVGLVPGAVPTGPVPGVAPDWSLPHLVLGLLR